MSFVVLRSEAILPCSIVQAVRQVRVVDHVVEMPAYSQKISV